MKWYEFIFLIVWVLIPIFGIVGYYNDITWLFYAAGILSLVIAGALLYFGEMGCLTVAFLLVSLAIGYYITSTIWNGLLLGSCILFTVIYAFMIIIMCFSGVSTIKGFFKKDTE